MKRLSNNRDLFEAKTNEVITVTIGAEKTPHQVTFSDLESGGQWSIVQAPTPQQPIEKRQFTMPSGSRDFFAIVYAFPPSGQTNPGAKYHVSFSGEGGTTDGPNSVLPPASGDLEDLPYEFRLPNAPLDHFLPSGLAAKVRSTGENV